MTRSLVLAAALAAALGMPGAMAAGPQHLSGSVTVELPRVMSLAELQQLLLRNGYTDIQLSPVPPNMYDVRPDIQWNAPGAAKYFDLAETPVRKGWNGTAVKDDRRLNINIDINAAAGRVVER